MRVRARHHDVGAGLLDPKDVRGEVGGRVWQAVVAVDGGDTDGLGRRCHRLGPAAVLGYLVGEGGESGDSFGLDPGREAAEAGVVVVDCPDDAEEVGVLGDAPLGTVGPAHDGDVGGAEVIGGGSDDRVGGRDRRDLVVLDQVADGDEVLLQAGAVVGHDVLQRVPVDTALGVDRIDVGLDAERVVGEVRRQVAGEVDDDPERDRLAVAARRRRPALRGGEAGVDAVATAAGDRVAVRERHAARSAAVAVVSTAGAAAASVPALVPVDPAMGSGAVSIGRRVVS